MIVYCLGLSVFGPIIMGSVYLITSNNYKILIRPLNIKTTNILGIFWIKIGVLLCSFINPLVIRALYEYRKEMTRRYARQIDSIAVKYLTKMKEVKSQYVELIKITLSMEHFFQTFIQALLILLARTQTSTTGGLEVLFTKTSIFGFPADFVLIFALLSGLWSCLKLHVKSIKTEKMFLPFTANIACYCWATVATAKRLLSLVAFFVPSMGLCNLLYHWKAEQVPFIYRKFAAEDNWMKPNDTINLYNTTRPVFWSEIDRFDYTNPSSPIPPDYTYYTGINLTETTFIFGLTMVFHFMTTVIVKAFTVDNFKRWSFMNMFVHIIYAMNIASPAEDWDQGKFTVEEYKRRHQKVNREMNWNIAVNFLFALVLTCPLVYTGILKRLKRFCQDD